MNGSNKKRELVINKVKRFPVTVFLKRILPLVVAIFLLFLTFLFGLWNVREFDYGGSELDAVSSNDLDSYLTKYIGENIFLLSISDVEKKLLDSNGYIKEVYIEKVLPWKLEINIKEFKPTYLGYSSNRCILFADTGKMITEICKECEQECLEKKTTELYLVSDSSLEGNGVLIFYDEISSIQRILSEFEYTVDSIEISKGIARVKDIEGQIFIFDMTYDFDTQLGRVYIVCQKIDEDMIKFSSLDLRFERPVMRLK